MSKFGYATYVKERLTGFGGPGEPIALSEFADVPGFAPRVALELDAPSCNGPVTYVGQAALDADIANLKAALEGTDVAEAFMNSASPGTASAPRSCPRWPGRFARASRTAPTPGSSPP